MAQSRDRRKADEGKEGEMTVEDENRKPGKIRNSDKASED